jgi:hypothetical protein
VLLNVHAPSKNPRLIVPCKYMMLMRSRGVSLGCNFCPMLVDKPSPKLYRLSLWHMDTLTCGVPKARLGRIPPSSTTRRRTVQVHPQPLRLLPRARRFEASEEDGPDEGALSQSLRGLVVLRYVDEYGEEREASYCCAVAPIAQL